MSGALVGDGAGQREIVTALASAGRRATYDLIARIDARRTGEEFGSASMNLDKAGNHGLSEDPEPKQSNARSVAWPPSAQ